MSFGQWASDYLGVPLEERFNFNPLTYFLYSGIDGAWFDPEDMSTMFRDAAGTTPVTALEQPVGLWLDKSQGLELGPELVTNGTFDSDTAWTKGGGWTISGGSAVMLTAQGSTSNLSQATGFIAGKTYLVTFTSTVLSGSFTAYVVGNNSGTMTTSGVKTARITANANGGFAITAFAGFTGTIDNISVREIKGNHATQSITASRPTLSARYNLLTKTEDFADAAWLKEGGGVGSTPSITPNYGIAPDGTQTACRVILNLNAGNLIGDFSRLSQIISSIPAKTTACSSIYVRTNDGSTKSIMLSLGGEAQSVIPVTPEWRQVSTVGFRADIGYSPRFELRGTFGTSDSADILIWHPQLNIGTTPLPYQRVNTATDYDSVGWPKYLRGDGVDDFYNLPFMNLYGNGACSIVAARDAVSQSTDTYIISERSTTDVDPKYFPSRQLARGGNMDSYVVSDEGTVRLDTTGSAFSGTKLAAIRSVVDTGSNIKLFKDGAVVADDNYTRSGTLTLTNTTIGASVSTTISNYANMKLYGLIITKSALSDTDRRRCEQFLASRLSTLGVTLS